MEEPRLPLRGPFSNINLNNLSHFLDDEAIRMIGVQVQEIAKFESFGQVLIKTKNDKKRKVVVVTLKSLDRTPFFLELWQSHYYEH